MDNSAIKSLIECNMLLIEDNDDFVQNAVAMFGMFVKKVYVASSVEEARGTLKNEKIDLIFSDIHLKNSNGLDFVEELRVTNQKTPIVIMSGHKDEDLLFRAMVLSLSGYLLKPINFKELMGALEVCAKKLELAKQTRIPIKDGFVYSYDLKQVEKDGHIYELNKKEILFFEMLIENLGKILTREMFLGYVWNYEEMTDSALNNFIMRIRRRFGKNFVSTIPNLGYKMIM